ncbi:MAG: archease [Nitrospirota bacterium]|nr:archease [Nitrospirota bacterium]
MAKGYRVLENVALADTAFEAWGDSPSQLFEATSQAVIETMVTPSTVGTSWRKDITLQDTELHELLFEWLSQIVFLKDAEAVLFHHVECQVWKNQRESMWLAQGVLTGDPINHAIQELHTDVKAITKHLYEVRQDGERWCATIVLDV